MMTPEYKANLLRILRPLLAVLLGILLTAVAFRLAGSASAACQCPRPITIAFPYAAILWSTAKWESVGGVLMAFQYPVYALVVALGKTQKRRAHYALVLVGVHTLAVIIGLLMYRAS